MPVAQTATAAFQQLDFLSMLGYLAQELAGFGIEHCSAHRHLDGAVLTVLAETASAGAWCTVAGKHVAHVFQVQECPQVAVGA